jgi:hypothetical protein
VLSKLDLNALFITFRNLIGSLNPWTIFRPPSSHLSGLVSFLMPGYPLFLFFEIGTLNLLLFQRASNIAIRSCLSFFPLMREREARRLAQEPTKKF